MSYTLIVLDCVWIIININQSIQLNICSDSLFIWEVDKSFLRVYSVGVFLHKVSYKLIVGRPLRPLLVNGHVLVMGTSEMIRDVQSWANVEVCWSAVQTSWWTHHLHTFGHNAELQPKYNGTNRKKFLPLIGKMFRSVLFVHFKPWSESFYAY